MKGVGESPFTGAADCGGVLCHVAENYSPSLGWAPRNQPPQQVDTAPTGAAVAKNERSGFVPLSPCHRYTPSSTYMATAATAATAAALVSIFLAHGRRRQDFCFGSGVHNPLCMQCGAARRRLLCAPGVCSVHACWRRCLRGATHTPVWRYGHLPQVQPRLHPQHPRNLQSHWQNASGRRAAAAHQRTAASQHHCESHTMRCCHSLPPTASRNIPSGAAPHLLRQTCRQAKQAITPPPQPTTSFATSSSSRISCGVHPHAHAHKHTCSHPNLTLLCEFTSQSAA